ncbi:MAG TPA: hypothetical protein VFF68_05870 [Anaerolineaceae bacterium]|nr:hypothetical protein [Anaerolineaceae bacterium]
MIARFGTFFLLIGGGLLLLFVLSDLAGSPQLSLLAYGVLLVVAGILLRIRGPQARERHESRFRTLRRLRAQHNPDSSPTPPTGDRKPY